MLLVLAHLGCPGLGLQNEFVACSYVRDGPLTHIRQTQHDNYLPKKDKLTRILQHQRCQPQNKESQKQYRNVSMML